MKLFQSIFGRGDTLGHYPETLIEMAIERAVDGTDPRLRLVPGYRKRLRKPVIHAIDQVIALVDGIPAPLTAGPDGYRNDFRLAALFASSDEMVQVFGRDKALSEYLASKDGLGAEHVTTLLLARREEKNILGMDLVGDLVRRDVAQVSVSFSGHHLLEPRTSEDESRRFLKRRAFDHLLALALAQIAEARVERADLTRQRDLLQRQLRAMKRGALTFAGPEAGQPDEASLQAELDAVAGQLKQLGADEGVLKAHLEIITERLGDGRAPALVRGDQPLPGADEHPARSRLPVCAPYRLSGAAQCPRYGSGDAANYHRPPGSAPSRGLCHRGGALSLVSRSRQRLIISHQPLWC